MSSIRKYFMMNHSAEKDGIWVQVNEVSFKLARAGGANKAFAKAVERLTRPHRKAIQFETLADTIGEEIVHKAYAETVVLDWDGVDESDILPSGTVVEEDKEFPPLTFSVENCLALFKAQPDLFVLLREMADTGANFRQSLLEGDAGN